MATDVWRQILLAEDAAVYAYAVVAANSTGEWQQAALDARTLHARARDSAADRITGSGGDPATPSVYELPFVVKNQKAAKQLARTVELRLVDTYVIQVAATSDSDRRDVIESAQAATVRAMRWGWDPSAFPPGPGTDQSAPAAPVPSPTRS